MSEKGQCRIGLIGCGNVGTHLAAALVKSGFQLRAIYARRIEAAEATRRHALAPFHLSADRTAKAANETRYECIACDSLETMGTCGIDLLIFCVSDDAISPLAQEAAKYMPKALFVHTAGSVPMSVFQGVAHQYGVIYPLQTFSKSRSIQFADVPLFVEGSDDEVESKLLALTTRLSTHVQLMDSQRRKNLHLSAVFACNFPNALFGVAEDLLSEAGVPRQALAPLIEETLKKFIADGAAASQTGPAKRNDQVVIARQEAMLSHEPLKLEVYRVLTDLIRQSSRKSL
ncbi:MAG: DUF2520 domain-containing protein [Bacteroidaceae bacterium]|nr:DUF2520 domain-containing protein [Bacteroidaceae bacterium]